MTMQTIETEEMIDIMKVSGSNIAPLFFGDTGVGKTTQVEKYAEEIGATLVTLVLSQLEPSETLGIPVKTTREYNGQEYTVLEQAMPKWVFDLANSEKAILFLDELLSADPSVIKPFLNLLTQKKINGIDLTHVQIIAATNFSRYSYEPDENVVSRFALFYVENNSFLSYINETRYNIEYEDEMKERTFSADFAMPHFIKPRNAEQLKQVPDDYLPLFYTAFTNKPFPNIVSDDMKLNKLLYPYYDFNNNKFFDESINIVAVTIKENYPRVRNYDEFLERNIQKPFDLQTLKTAIENVDLSR